MFAGSAACHVHAAKYSYASTGRAIPAVPEHAAQQSPNHGTRCTISRAEEVITLGLEQRKAEPMRPNNTTRL